MVETVTINKKSEILSKLPPKLKGFIAGGLGACCAVTFTNPFEVVKTRLQLQGELTKQSALSVRPYKNLPQAFVKILRTESIFGIQRGLVAAYNYQLVMNGVRFGLYDILRQKLPDSYLSSMLSATISGSLGAVLGSPLFLIKTRLQAYSPIIKVGTQYNYRGVIHGLTTVYKKEGIKGWFRGTPASALRTSIGSMVQLPTYEKTKKYSQSLDIEGTQLHLISSMVSGFFVCCAMNPFDVITTRLYNQPRDPITNKPLLYKSIFECLTKTVKAEGPKGLLKGFTAHYFRIGPHTILTFVFMEKFKKWLA